MISNKYIENSIEGARFESLLLSLKKVFSLKNIIFIILSFAMSNQSFSQESSLLSFVMFGVASVFNVPLILVLLSSIVGLAVSSITMSVLIKLLAFFVLFTILTAAVNIEGVSRRFSVFIKFMISVIVVEVIFNIVYATLASNLFSILSNILIVAVLYFIFVSGIYVLTNIGKGYVFSREENVAMIIMIAIALTIFKDLQVLNFSIFNIAILILVLIFGWKSGWITGAASGLIVGLMLTVISDVNMTYIVTLAFSGMIAGILSKVGKIGVIIGFILGNLYISYYSNGFSEITMRISELVIASISLLFMPRALEIKLDKLFNKNNTLSRPYENMLDAATSVREKIGAVSDVFDSLADIVVKTTPEDDRETREVIKRYIENYVENNCIDCTNKKECMNDDKLEIIVDYMATKLENNEKIEPSMLNFDCDSSSKIINDIYEVYSSMKLMRILKQKEQENNIKLSEQYKEVSKILTNISKNIKNQPLVKNEKHQKLKEELKFYGYLVYEDEYTEVDRNIEYTFVTNILTNIDKQKKEIISIASDILEQNVTIKLILNSSKTEKSRIKLVSIPDFEVKTSIINEPKHGEMVSGDSYLSQELEDLKQINIISDGQGSGKSAARASGTVINMLEKLLKGGFTEQKAIEIINSIVKLKSNESNLSTLDSIVINLRNAETEFIKLGAAPTYIIEDGKIITITNPTIPVGIVSDTEYVPICKTLKDNDIVIQISDGVVTDNMDVTNNYFINYLRNIDVNKNTKSICEELHRCILKEYKNLLTDDITIIVTKIKRVK